MIYGGFWFRSCRTGGRIRSNGSLSSDFGSEVHVDESNMILSCIVARTLVHGQGVPHAFFEVEWGEQGVASLALVEGNKQSREVLPQPCHCAQGQWDSKESLC
mmetsp:Transcript_2711/g.5796  ORF Transcript_2711/g.5796 Transcript_2711/m.5796 type:complete len:103 (-) Transcript_2711:9643-9951(-)